jgi:hypothetical protein
MAFEELHPSECQIVVHVEDSLGAVAHFVVDTSPLSFCLVNYVCIRQHILFRPC